MQQNSLCSDFEFVATTLCGGASKNIQDRVPPKRRLVQPHRPGAQLRCHHDGPQWPLLLLLGQVVYFWISSAHLCIDYWLKELGISQSLESLKVRGILHMTRGIIAFDWSSCFIFPFSFLCGIITGGHLKGVLGVYRPLRPKSAIPHPITIQNMRFEQ